MLCVNWNAGNIFTVLSVEREQLFINSQSTIKCFDSKESNWLKSAVIGWLSQYFAIAQCTKIAADLVFFQVHGRAWGRG